MQKEFIDAINFLIADEQEAYDGYIEKSKELSEKFKLPEELTQKLLFIANEELNHIVILKTMLDEKPKFKQFRKGGNQNGRD